MIYLSNGHKRVIGKVLSNSFDAEWLAIMASDLSGPTGRMSQSENGPTGQVP